MAFEWDRESGGCATYRLGVETQRHGWVAWYRNRRHYWWFGTRTRPRPQASLGGCAGCTCAYSGSPTSGTGRGRGWLARNLERGERFRELVCSLHNKTTKGNSCHRWLTSGHKSTIGDRSLHLGRTDGGAARSIDRFGDNAPFRGNESLQITR